MALNRETKDFTYRLMSLGDFESVEELIKECKVTVDFPVYCKQSTTNELNSSVAVLGFKIYKRLDCNNRAMYRSVCSHLLNREFLKKVQLTPIEMKCCVSGEMCMLIVPDVESNLSTYISEHICFMSELYKQLSRYLHINDSSVAQGDWLSLNPNY